MAFDGQIGATLFTNAMRTVCNSCRGQRDLALVCSLHHLNNTLLEDMLTVQGNCIGMMSTRSVLDVTMRDRRVQRNWLWDATLQLTCYLARVRSCIRKIV